MKVVNYHAGCCGFYPVRPDGTQWPHVLGLPAGASVHADTPAEVLAEVIDGYADLESGDARLEARRRHSIEAVIAHQELRIQQALTDGLVDQQDPDDADLIALLRQVRGQPLRLTDPEDPAGVPQWRAPIRLVVSAHLYAPETELPLPTGNVDVIDPADEGDYLLSLRAAGVLDYWAETAPAESPA